MYLDEFWDKITYDLTTKSTFTTLNQRKKFSATAINGIIHITPFSSSHLHIIRKDDFTRVWNAGLTLDSDLKLKPGMYSNLVRTASYIVTLISSFQLSYNTK